MVSACYHIFFDRCPLFLRSKRVCAGDQGKRKYTVNNFVTAIRIRDRDIRKVHPNYTKKQIQKIQKKP